MKHSIIILISTFLISILCFNTARGTMAASNLHSTTHELAPGGPYPFTQIEMEWSLPEGYSKSQISSFYYVFTSSNTDDLTTATEIMAYTGNEQADPDDYMNNTFTISKSVYDFIDENFVQYWFHIAAVGIGFPPASGDSVHLGPFQIDIYPPKNPYIKEINESTITSDSDITISMSASTGLGGVNCVRYWFLNQAKPIHCSEKEFFPFVTSVELPDFNQGDYPKTYTVMAEFEDKAGNKSSTTSYQIQYNPESTEDTNLVKKNIPALTKWGIFIFLIIILFTSLRKMYSLKLTKLHTCYQ